MQVFKLFHDGSRDFRSPRIDDLNYDSRRFSSFSEAGTRNFMLWKKPIFVKWAVVKELRSNVEYLPRLFRWYFHFD